MSQDHHFFGLDGLLISKMLVSLCFRRGSLCLHLACFVFLFCHFRWLNFVVLDLETLVHARNVFPALHRYQYWEVLIVFYLLSCLYLLIVGSSLSGFGD
jgi:hypothetical protein